MAQTRAARERAQRVCKSRHNAKEMHTGPQQLPENQHNRHPAFLRLQDFANKIVFPKRKVQKEQPQVASLTYSLLEFGCNNVCNVQTPEISSPVPFWFLQALWSLTLFPSSPPSHILSCFPRPSKEKDAACQGSMPARPIQLDLCTKGAASRGPCSKVVGLLIQ